MGGDDLVDAGLLAHERDVVVPDPPCCHPASLGSAPTHGAVLVHSGRVGERRHLVDDDAEPRSVVCRGLEVVAKAGSSTRGRARQKPATRSASIARCSAISSTRPAAFITSWAAIPLSTTNSARSRPAREASAVRRMSPSRPSAATTSRTARPKRLIRRVVMFLRPPRLRREPSYGVLASTSREAGEAASNASSWRVGAVPAAGGLPHRATQPGVGEVGELDPLGHDAVLDVVDAVGDIVGEVHDLGLDAGTTGGRLAAHPAEDRQVILVDPELVDGSRQPVTMPAAGRGGLRDGPWVLRRGVEGGAGEVETDAGAFRRRTTWPRAG